MYLIQKCTKCNCLPDIHVCGRAEGGPKAKIVCCGFGVEVSAHSKEEALKTATDGWNMAMENRK